MFQDDIGSKIQIPSRCLIAPINSRDNDPDRVDRVNRVGEKTRTKPLPEDPISDLIGKIDPLGWKFESLHRKGKRGGWQASARHTITHEHCSAVASDYKSALRELYLAVLGRIGNVAPSANKTSKVTKRSSTKPKLAYPHTPQDSDARSAAIHAADQASLATKSSTSPSRSRKTGRVPVLHNVWKAPVRPLGRSRSEIAIQLGVSRRKVEEAAKRLGIASDMLSDDEARQIIVDIQ